MGEIEIPILPAQTKLIDALEYLRNAGVSAVMIEKGSQKIVLDRAALLVSRTPGNRLLADIPPSTATIDLPHGDQSDPILESLLDADNAHFGHVASRGPFAAIITRHEYYEQDMRLQMSYCTCRDPDHHVWAPGDLLVSGKCDVDGSVVDCT